MLTWPLHTHDNRGMFRLNLMLWDKWRFLTLLLRGCSDLPRNANRLPCEGRRRWSIGSRLGVFSWIYERETTDNRLVILCFDCWVFIINLIAHIKRLTVQVEKKNFLSLDRSCIYWGSQRFCIFENGRKSEARFSGVVTLQCQTMKTKSLWTMKI